VDLNRIKQFIKKSPIAKKTYKTIKESMIDVSIPEITPLNARKSTLKEKRINLMLPSINQEHLFGGISTALNFFELLTSNMNVKKRIILTDAAPNENAINSFNQYKFTKCSDDFGFDLEIVPFSDRYNKTIPVGENDYFLSTAWWTAFHSQNLIKWQSNEYLTGIKPHIYFIQDYEPGFYPWSSHYLLAESTYKYDDGPQIGIFNTKILKDFFEEKSYIFSETFHFNPVLNSSIRPLLLDKIKSEINKEKIILIYGRPSVQRNAFPLIVEALKIWVWKFEDASEWQIISAGEKHPDIDLGNNKKIISVGKLSLNDYANLLLKSSVGISLMVSPHPSYPPLEMASFGLKVITNNYDIKDLSRYNNNFTSLENLVPNKISDELIKQCTQYKENMLLEYPNFGDVFDIENKEMFSFISDIRKIIEK